jgi:hypothetical protein
VTTRGTTLAALLLALGRPVWWLLGLAGFLVRGGIVVFLLAIVSLPSPLVLSNIFGPLVVPLAFGTLLPTTAILIAVGLAIALFWLVAGSWFAAASEVALILETVQAAADEGLGDRATARAAGAARGRRTSARVAAAHLIAHIPTAFALGLGSVAIIAATYRELTNPSDSGPIILRVVVSAALTIAVIVTWWLVGELVGGHAARRIVLDDAAVLTAVGRGALDLVRHPVGGLVVPLLMTAVLAIDLGAVLGIVAIVLTDVRDRLIHPLADPLATLLTVATLGAAWSLALIVTGLIAAWRGAAMTLDHERRRNTRATGASPGSDVAPEA